MPKYSNMTEAEWLAFRRSRIGASDVPAILGLCPWRSPYRVWAEKSGLMPASDVTLAMRAGHALEQLVAEEFAAQVSMSVCDEGPYTVYVHPIADWLVATPDRLIVSVDEPDDIGLLECKTSGGYRAEDWEGDEIPLDYQVQLLTQLMVTGYRWGAVAALMSYLSEFRWRVANGEPPDPDDHPDTGEALLALHPRDNGETVKMDLQDEINCMKLEDLKRDVKRIEAEIRERENRLKALIGDATYALGGNYRYSFKHQARKPYCKVDAGLEPQLNQHGLKYEIKGGAEYRVLRRVKGDSDERD
jgi:putative phage-type endonuclease